MTPERYQQIDQIFQEALQVAPEQRSTFLDAACSGDLALRSHVESLLSSDGLGLSYIDDPALNVAAQLLPSGESELTIGEQIDRYTILSLLGTGGMGEVYLAHESKLDRRVALKLLPSDFLSDPERV